MNIKDKNNLIENIAWHEYEVCKKRMKMNFFMIEDVWNIERLDHGFLIWRDVDGIFEFNGYKDKDAPFGWLKSGLEHGQNLAKSLGYKKVRLWAEGKMGHFLKNVGYFEKEL